MRRDFIFAYGVTEVGDSSAQPNNFRKDLHCKSLKYSAYSVCFRQGNKLDKRYSYN